VLFVAGEVQGMSFNDNVAFQHITGFASRH
jgi:hypothetical protein